VLQTMWSTLLCGTPPPVVAMGSFRKCRALAALAGDRKFRRRVSGFLPGEGAATGTTLKLSFTLGPADLCAV
jgi:hypothetical protein